jgi:hypothetical protein
MRLIILMMMETLIGKEFVVHGSGVDPDLYMKKLDPDRHQQEKVGSDQHDAHIQH